MELILIGIGALVFLAHLFAGLFDKTRVPDVVPLVLLGLLLGPVLGLVAPAMFGRVGGVFTTVALVIILFQGGLGLNFRVLRESVGEGGRLTLLNFAASLAVAAPLSRALLGTSWMESFLVGSIVGGTSSAVVIPLAAKLELEERSKTILLLESAFSDVLCIVMTIALLESIRSNDLRPGLIAGQVVASLVMACVIGATGAAFWSNFLARVRQLENSLFTTPAFVCIIFGLAELLGYSGAIAALAFGVVLGNVEALAGIRLSSPVFSRLKPVTLNATEEALFAELVFLLKTFFFVYIGLSVRFADWRYAAVGALLTAGFFVARILVVRGALPADVPRADASVAAVMVPKGLAAAVLAALPLQAGLACGAVVQDVVYAVVLCSIAATTLLTFLLERGSIAAPYAAALAPFAPSRGGGRREGAT